jgi:hypothetical protein
MKTNNKLYECKLLGKLKVLIRKNITKTTKNLKKKTSLKSQKLKLQNSNNFVDKLIKNKKFFKDSIGETICREYIQYKLKKSFKKVRPDFLKNPVTGKNLEIDCFCQELNLGIEYNGKQHYEYTPKFHNNKQDFYSQKYRDYIKDILCEKNGINLIKVPWNIPHKKIPLYIQNILDEMKIK